MSAPAAAAHRPALSIAVIALAGLALNLIYSIIVPPWMGPDEPRHVEYALLIVEKGRLVTWADPLPAVEQKITRSMDQYNFWRFGLVSPEVFKPGTAPTRFDQIWSQGLTHELHQPPLYYLLLAPVTWISRGLDVAVQVALMRVVSALLATLTVLLVWLTAREAFPEQPLLALAAACFAAFLPMHAFMAGVVNNDVLAEVLGALCIYLMVRGQCRGFSLALFVACVIVIVLGLLAKRTTVFLLPLLGVAVILPLRHRIRFAAWRAAALLLALATAVAWAGSRVLDELAKHSARLPGPLQSLVYVYVFFLVRPSAMHATSVSWRDFITADAFAYYRRWLQMLFETFWARFGWVNVRVHWSLYVLLAAISLAAIAGACVVIWEAWRGKSPKAQHQQDSIVLLATGVVFALGVLVIKMIREWDVAHPATTQARFLFPALSPIAILFALGLFRLLPERWHVPLVRVAVAGLILLNVVSLLVYIVPFYHPV